MKPFSLEEVTTAAQLDGHEELIWITTSSGITKPSMKVGNQTSFIAGAKYQYEQSLMEFQSMEKEILELRKFKEDTIKIATELYLPSGKK